MIKNLILIGWGGHCNSCIDVIETQNKYKIKGIVERNKKINVISKNYPTLGYDKDLPEISKKNKYFFITIGQIKNHKKRRLYYNKLKNLDLFLPIIISPYSYVSKHTNIGEGTIVMHLAMVNINAKIGFNCIINSQALLEHDVVVGNHCHISTGAKLNGSVTIGDNVFIGSGAIIHQGVNIKSNSIIPAGKIVKKNILWKKTRY